MPFFFIIILGLDCKPKELDPIQNVPQMSAKVNSDEPNPNSINEDHSEKNTVNTSMKKDSLPKQHFDIEYIMGKFNPIAHNDFTKIAKKHADQDNRYLRKDAYEAFIKMYEAALKGGISLKIISATRNFDNQKSIWERKWNGVTILEGGLDATTIKDKKKRALKILEFSSMPGTSRHHWGTDIDLNNLNNEYFETGQGKKVYDWLTKNAQTFGFVQVYTAKDEKRPQGYNEERWHWSYKPISSQLTALAQSELKDVMITGFDGSETAKGIQIVERYVLGINKQCFK